MSVTLGIGNMLPIPCLNGWKVLETAYELVVGRPLPVLVSAWSGIVGLVILLVFCLCRWLLLDILWLISIWQ